MPHDEKRGRHLLRLIPGRPLAAAIGAAAIAATVLATGAGARQTATPPSNTTAPSISGTAAVGSLLTGSPGSWAGDTPISFAYAWQRCNTSGAACAAIPGATATTYTLLQADSGNTVRLAVTATNPAGVGSALAPATAVVSATAAPANTGAPALSGSAVDGSTLTVSDGSWTGASSFRYQWRRCDTAGNSCVDASGIVQSRDITLAAADVGHAMRAIVYASNGGGTTQAVTAPSAVVAAKPSGPANTAAPTISGTVAIGQTLTAAAGTWTGASPITYTYQWRRCDAAGNSCVDASNPVATNTITLAAADAGKTIRVVVAAKNGGGTTQALSAQTGVVAGPPSDEVRLSDGRISVSADRLALPVRLVISRVQFTPTRLTGRASFSMKVWVSDTQNHAVRDALVLATTLPYGWTRQPAENRTGPDGSVTLTLTPSVRMPVRNASLVVFLRARGESGDPLAGTSSRRLVQVRIG